MGTRKKVFVPAILLLIYAQVHMTLQVAFGVKGSRAHRDETLSALVFSQGLLSLTGSSSPAGNCYLSRASGTKRPAAKQNFTVKAAASSGLSVFDEIKFRNKSLVTISTCSPSSFISLA